MTSIKESFESDKTSTQKPQLLVLDDEASVRKLIVRILARDGYEIHETSTIAEAHAAAQSLARLDVWVTDANVDGSDASLEVERFRALHPNLAVVLVSGCDPEADRHAILTQLGVIFLAKPFTPVQLREAVDLSLRRGSTTSAVVCVAALASEAAPVAR